MAPYWAPTCSRCTSTCYVNASTHYVALIFGAHGCSTVSLPMTFRSMWRDPSLPTVNIRYSKR